MEEDLDISQLTDARAPLTVGHLSALMADMAPDTPVAIMDFDGHFGMEMPRDVEELESLTRLVQGRKLVIRLYNADRPEV